MDDKNKINNLTEEPLDQGFINVVDYKLKDKNAFHINVHGVMEIHN